MVKVTHIPNPRSDDGGDEIGYKDETR